MKPSKIDPFLLFYLINNRLVQDQIKHKIFIQSTIATLGNRLKEILIPIPNDSEFKNEISEKMKTRIFERLKLLYDAMHLIDSGMDKSAIEI